MNQCGISKKQEEQSLKEAQQESSLWGQDPETITPEALKDIITDFRKCDNIAVRMASCVPEYKGVWSGTVSQRIKAAFTEILVREEKRAQKEEKERAKLMKQIKKLQAKLNEFTTQKK